jgi:hypothetical protein
MFAIVGKLMSLAGGRPASVPALYAMLKDGPISQVPDDKAYAAFAVRLAPSSKVFVQAVHALMA